MKSNAQKVCKECKKETQIEYKYGDGFFKPRLKGINHLEVGYSKIISNPITIIVEFFYWLYERVLDRWEHFLSWLFPRRTRLHQKQLDSYLTGQIVHPGGRGDGAAIHNVKVEFWARTYWGKWRKLGLVFSDEKGKFHLPFTLRKARNWQLARLYCEFHEVFEVGYDGEEPFTKYRLYKRLRVKKSDLIGMGYDFNRVPLHLWEYRKDSLTPRTYFPENPKEAPEVYSRGRENALIQQIIPIELTKQKHLFQIKEEPGVLTREKIQEDYPENLTVCIEKKMPGYTRSDEWFGERMMNGMNKATFVTDPSDPVYSHVKIFGRCHYDHNQQYALPNVDIRFMMREGSAPLPVEITLTGPLNSYDRNPWQKHQFTPSDGDKWMQAKRVARTVGAVSAEAEDHFAGTHVNTEQYTIAANRNLRINPVAYLLIPHLKEVALINHAADKTIIEGYLPTATALTAKGIRERVYDSLGFHNWKGWKPMKIETSAHRFARAENLFWDLTGQFVDYFFEKYEADIKKHWYEIYAMSRDLVNHSVPVFMSKWDPEKMSREEVKLMQERMKYGCLHYHFDPKYSTEVVNDELKALSPITLTKRFQKDEDFENLREMCRYVIMTATFSHTWINEHQYDDLGDIMYNCGGLRFGNKERGVMAPESDLSIAPDLTRSTQMLWFTNLLSRTEYGFITENEEKDIHPYFIELLKKHKSDFEQMDVNVEAIESRTNI
ncbi:MAG: hypothetical protein GVX96_00175 [Bacteroidetes bacterium]|jgi:hypothetical protein|nr:hypothetical protein [Bacteroidota bacterium]